MDVTERLLNTKVVILLGFLWFVVEFLRSDYLGYSIRWKKCLYAINGTLLFGGNRYILSGIILHRTSILYLKWYKSIDLAELHNVEHLI